MKSGVSSIVGIFYGRGIFWYFIHENRLKSYDFMCKHVMKVAGISPFNRLTLTANFLTKMFSQCHIYFNSKGHNAICIFKIL